MLDKTETQAPSISDMLDAFAEKNAEREKSAPSISTFNHETDDQGFPLCMCPACRERSKIVNAQYVARLFGPMLAGPSERRNPSIDYDKLDNGHDDYEVTPPQSASR